MNRIIIIILSGLLLFGCTKPPLSPQIDDTETATDIVNKALVAKKYCVENDFNTEFCILIDMSIHSGKKRFFVWDFESNSASKSYMVSHGCCDNLWLLDQSASNPTFSNIPDSHCSSLGKYKIGDRGWSNFGVNINYRLQGLEETNSNANSRDIVFHSWEEVTDEEVFPRGTAEGWGCPAIADNSFLEIDPLLRNSEKPVLMWIYK